MKSPITLQTNVAIAVIIAGLVLLLFPYFHSLIFGYNMTIILTQTEHTTARLNTNLPDWYDGAAFFVGCLLCGAGILGGMKQGDEKNHNEDE